MRHSALLMMIVAGLLGAAGTAEAQPGRRVGLVIGYPASLGVHWQIGDRVAVRPDVTLNWTQSETTSTLTSPGQASTVTTTSSVWTTALGLSGLFYLAPSGDDLRFYVIPRAAYIWSRTEVDNSPQLPQLGPYESEGSGFQASGAFGAQYAAHERFRLFGELGLGYTAQRSDTGYTLSRSRLEQRGFGLRSGVGVVVMF